MSGPRSRLTGIDTNVLLRVLLQDDPVQGPIAARFLRELGTGSPGFITQVTLAETYWVLARAKRLPRATCLAVIRRLVETEVLEFDDGEGVVRALSLAEAGADFADALIQGAMELFGVDETVTFDRAAAERLGWTLLDA
ncbi:MAG: type II toxin-antitoxin system VapC family toxin [Micropruina sp.]|nr:type II toxin-antitoxin system VapC family toxin [Micropruina sp.]